MPIDLRITIPAQKHNSKYKNIKCVCNGVSFPSLKEGRRYAALKRLEIAGEIYKLQLQVPFKIMVNGQAACTYKADFTYFTKHGKYVVEDAKGMQTPVYRLKKKLLFLTTGIEITEV